MATQLPRFVETLKVRAETLLGDGSTLTRYAAPVLSLAMLGAALAEIYALDWSRVAAMVPASPAFWLVFATVYFVPPLCDWMIYHRLWNIPFANLTALIRKAIGNDLLIGYAGDAYLFAWARRAGKSGSEAFGAVKDTAILSAVVGNSVTLVLALAAWPMIGRLGLHVPLLFALASIAMISVPIVTTALFHKKLFYQSPRELGMIASLHGLRATLTIAFTALLWHLALPSLGVSTLLIFSALKLLVTRLPLVSNRDVMLAGVTAMLFPSTSPVAEMMAMIALLTVVTHATVGLGVSASGLIERRKLVVLHPVPALA